MWGLFSYIRSILAETGCGKCNHTILLIFFTMLANADDWVEMEVFGKEHENFLRNYLELPNGIPSHDTIQRVFAMVPSEFLESFQRKWNEMSNSDEGD
ncbi:transposase family protein [Lachnospiraceae bacterium 45-W7]